MPTNSKCLLSTAYLPPVQYISKFLFYPEIFIEKHENYQKQSYRNRCYIYGANGKQCLVIPIKKNHGEKMPITQVEIDYSGNWQKIHLKSIESAYRLSPFYEFYADEFIEIFSLNHELLIDLNNDILNRVLKMLGISCEIKLTESWEKEIPYHSDYRNSISPKKRLEKTDLVFNSLSYQQVFIERYGFIPNLSTIDLLFNEGPAAKNLLKAMVNIRSGNTTNNLQQV